METDPAERPAPRGHLGTFLGVYTPTTLTILGVILFLRSGWLVGHLGIWQTMLVVVLAHCLTIVTSLAAAAIATNTHVGVGGAYYIVSRSLGFEIGGAIGVPLYLSQTLSVTLYAFGLAESLQILLPWLPVQPTAAVVILAVGGLVYRGAGLALKAQLPLLALVALALLALAVGALADPASGGRLEFSVASREVGFWTAFAVFFPAVTGIMAGLGLSGDLRDPKRALPRGMILAVLTGMAVYLVVPWFLALGADPGALRDDPLVWTQIALLGGLLVMPGLWGAILSSAIGSALAAPRTLQALAFDRLAPGLFARTSGPNAEPVLGTLLSLGVALAAVLLGDLNHVAPLVTMFFLTVYGVTSLVAALETLGGDVSWRPRIRVPWWIYLAGFLGCLAVMFLINPAFAAVAVVCELVLWRALARVGGGGVRGDARRSLFESLIRMALIGLAKRPMAARNWRPHVLVFSRGTEHNLDLIRFGDLFSQGRGVVSCCELMVGDVQNMALDPVARRREIQASLDREGLVVFAEAHVVPRLVDGMVTVAQANGIGAMESNTLLVGWSESDAKRADLLTALRRLERVHKSVVIGRIESGAGAPRHRGGRIDIWWGGLEHNGDLMILLAHLLIKNRLWMDHRIRILSIAEDAAMQAATTHSLEQLLAEVRIAADVRVFRRDAGRPVVDMIHAESGDADVVFLGLALPDPEGAADYARRMEELATGLRTVFFVRNASEFVGELIFDPTESAP